MTVELAASLSDLPRAFFPAKDLLCASALTFIHRRRDSSLACVTRVRMGAT